MNTKLLRTLSLAALGLSLVACGATPTSSSQAPAEPKTVVADTSSNAESKSKKELLDDYNMKKFTEGCQWEWYEQAENFENWTIGKTIAEVRDHSYGPGHQVGVDVIEEGVGVTINTDNFTGALKSLNRVKTFTTSDAPVAGAGIALHTVENNVFTVKVAGAATSNSTKTILESAVNSYQIPLTTGAEDAISIDTTVKQAKNETIASKAPNSVTQVVSKYELQELYGMKGTSAGIGTIDGGAEWFEQAEAYEAYTEGKLASEISGEKNVATGCTMNVDGFAKAVKEAAGANVSKEVGTASANATYTLSVGSYVSFSTQIEVSICAVVTDSNNKIVSAYFDVLQQKVKIAE